MVASASVSDVDCDPVDPVVSLSVGACEFNQTSTYAVTYDLTINDGDTPFSLWADGVEIDGDLAAGDDVAAGDFAPGTDLEIRDGNGDVVASASVSDAECEPDVTVVKSNDADQDGEFNDDETAPGPDETVIFEVEVTNSGDVAGSVRLYDAFEDETLFLFGYDDVDGFADVEIYCDDGTGSDLVAVAMFDTFDVLQPGQSITCYFSIADYSPAAGGELVNTVTAELVEYTQRGDGPTTVLAEAEDDSTVRTPSVRTLPRPGIELVKTATLVDGEPLLADEFGDKVLPTFEGLDAAPQTVTYEYVVTNTGEVTLTDLSLVDDRLGTIDGTAGVVLEPGESETFLGTETFTVEDAQDPGTITNIGTVEGEALIDDVAVIVTDTDDETVVLEFVLDVVELAPSIDLVKTALVEPDADGVKVVTYDGTDDDEETITYEYLITNTGETELVDVTLVDDILGTILDGSEGVTLAPGESTTVEAVHVLTEADANAGEVVNVAVTTGTPPEGEDVTATDDEVVEVMEVLDEVVEEDDTEVLAATGFGTASRLAAGMAMILGGLALVMTGRRRETVWPTA